MDVFMDLHYCPRGYHPQQRPQMIDQEAICRFVNKIENHKKFKRDHNLIFRHIVSELGELDAKIFQYEKNVLAGLNQTTRYLDSKDVGFELLDIVFLCCYMADVFNINLDDLIEERMGQIKEKYNVKD